MTDAFDSKWMEALVSSANELATTALGFDEGTVTSVSDEMPEIALGSFIALAGEGEPIQIGLSATHAACMAMSRAMFCMEPDEEDLPEQDLSDCMGEMINVLAGGVKTRMAEDAPPVNIGLPMVLRGSIDLPSKAQVVVAGIRWGAVDASLLLLSKDGGT